MKNRPLFHYLILNVYEHFRIHITINLTLEISQLD